MKFLVLALLLAVSYAEPEPDSDSEADPWRGYGYGYGLGWPHYSGYGGSRTLYGYRGYGGYYGHGYYGRKKREAEPEPEADSEADPYVLYGNYYGYHGYPYHYPFVTAKKTEEAPAVAEVKTAAATTPLVYATHPYTYGYGGYHLPTTYGHHYPYTYGVYGRKKREADSDSESDPWRGYYGGYYGHGGYYGRGYYGGYGGYGGYPYHRGYGYGYYGK
jgi:hypothetical protein